MATATKPRTNVRTRHQTTVRSRTLPALGTGVRWMGRHFPDAAARLALAAWFRPRRYDPPRRELHWRMGATEFRIGRGTAGVRAWSWGSGPTVLLVHGWEGRGMQLGGFVQPLVDAGHRVVTWDAPAHGRSPGSRASLFSFADTVLAAVRQEGPVHGIIAHSMGAAATLLALQARFPLTRLALVAPGDPERAGERLAESLGLPEDVSRAIGDKLHQRFGQSLSAVSARRLIREVDLPTLVVHDPSDPHASFADAREMAENAPQGRFAEVSGLGHHRILRDPGVIAAVASHIAGEPVRVQPRGGCLTQDELLRDLRHGRD